MASQVEVRNEEALNEESFHNYELALNRPFFLVKPNAIDKAILMWLNYKGELIVLQVPLSRQSALLPDNYDFWREEKDKLLSSSSTDTKVSRKESVEVKKSVQPHDAIPMNINITLAINNGLHGNTILKCCNLTLFASACMPLYTSEPQDNAVALIISLEKTDVTIRVLDPYVWW